jgi:hypothetical protein
MNDIMELENILLVKKDKEAPRLDRINAELINYRGLLKTTILPPSKYVLKKS